MFDIDIERLMDLVDEENNASSDYRCKSKDLYKGDLEKLAECVLATEVDAHERG